MKDFPFGFWFIPLLLMLTMGLQGGLMTHEAIGVIVGGLLGFVVGAVLGMGHLYLHKEEVKKITGGIVSEALLDTAHIREIDIRLSHQKTVNLCKQALNIAGTGRIVAESETPSTSIHGEVVVNRFKQYVSMKIEPRDGYSHVIIKSETASTLSRGLDYGASLATVTRITQFLESASDAYNEGRRT